ncbi:MAG: serine/threonine protein kinase [Dehalococcoidia bacterium]|nr:serine/threonine protein kinase [Dehalococcoidia bacterium]
MTNPDDRTLTQIKQYRLVRKIGEGAMGAVFEATDARDGSRVAVKLLHPRLAAQDAGFRERFEREAHIAALLRSPYTVRLLDFGITGQSFFLVMEFVEGASVGDLLAERGPFVPDEALRIAIDAARALEEAAARSVIHRDIKPDNILLAADGSVKVADFGIARSAGGAGQTLAGGFTGTAEFAAPEQALGETDHRTDIYALGATLYCMLAGQPPFRGATAWDVVRQHQAMPVAMDSLAHLPDSVLNPLRRCLEKDPRDRYQTATELAGALERARAAYLKGQPPSPMAAAPPSLHPGAAPPPAGYAGQTRVAGGSPLGDPAVAQTRMAGPPPGRPLVPPSPSPGAASLRMSVSEPAQGPAGDIHYQLLLENLAGHPLQVTLAASEPSGSLAVMVTPEASLGPGEARWLPVEVHPLRRTAGAPGPVDFQIAALGPGGERLAFVNVMVQPAGVSPGRRSNRVALFGMGAAAAALAAAAIAAFAIAGGGGKDDDGQPPAASGSPLASQTVTVPAGATAPGSSPAASPSAGGSIAVLDRWAFTFVVAETTCAFGAKAGDRYNVAFRFTPAAGGQVIRDGDRVTVTGIRDKETVLGSFTFRQPGFTFAYPVAASTGEVGQATVTITFADEKTVKEAAVVERYTQANCSISGKSVGQ